MLKIENLCVEYDNITAVKDISFSVDKDEIVCIVGESGSGKSTIIKTIMNLLPEDANISKGKILYNGVNIQNKKCDCGDISIVFQDTRASLNPVRRIGIQFVEYIRKHRKISKRESYEIAKEFLLDVNLDERILKSYAFQLSGGMMQRVGIAFALSLHPNILLLDEPTSALDVTTQSQVIDNIIKLKQTYNTTILMITHNVPLALYMADKVVVMKHGEIVEMNTSVEIFRNPANEYTRELIKHIPKLRG